MDAKTPPIPAELLAVALENPTLAELLRRLARGEPGATLTLARLVRRLIDGTATADEGRARPLLEYVREGWRRSVESAVNALDRNDGREARFLIRQVLAHPADDEHLDHFYVAARAAAWRDCDGFGVVPYLKSVVRMEVDAAQAKRSEPSQWLPATVLRLPAVARHRRHEARRRAVETEYAEQLRAALVWSSERAEKRIHAQNELARMEARVRLTERQSELWRLVREEGMRPADALKVMGEDSETMPLWKSLKQKLQRVSA